MKDPDRDECRPGPLVGLTLTSMTPQPNPRPLGSKPAASPQPRVLIVDDDLAVRRVLRRWFARQGWHAVEAADGDQGRAILSSHGGGHFDVVLCDVRMPELSGPEFYAWLSVARPAEVSRLVFTTGDASEDGVAIFLRDTHCLVLEKPFELDELWTIVERLRGGSVAA